MALFQNKTKKTKPKVDNTSLFEKVVREAEAATTKWLHRHFYENRNGAPDPQKISGYVESCLEETIHNAILEKVGIDTSWSKTEIKYNSPLKRTIEEAAQQKAEQIATKFIKEEEMKIKGVPTDLKKAMEKVYEEEYKEHLIRTARELGERKAKADAAGLLSKLILNWGEYPQTVDESDDG